MMSPSGGDTDAWPGHSGHALKNACYCLASSCSGRRCTSPMLRVRSTSAANQRVVGVPALQPPLEASGFAGWSAGGFG